MRTTNNVKEHSPTRAQSHLLSDLTPKCAGRCLSIAGFHRHPLHATDPTVRSPASTSPTAFDTVFLLIPDASATALLPPRPIRTHALVGA